MISRSTASNQQIVWYATNFHNCCKSWEFSEFTYVSRKYPGLWILEGLCEPIIVQICHNAVELRDNLFSNQLLINVSEIHKSSRLLLISSFCQYTKIYSAAEHLIKIDVCLMMNNFQWNKRYTLIKFKNGSHVSHSTYLTTKLERVQFKVYLFIM